MSARALMFQGTGSDVGKSLIVAGLCRAFADRGLSVAPFKPQNMSNNAAVAQGGEIGRAQALQAKAARLTPHVDMNPVLLKPESEGGAQVIVQGQRAATLSARAYFSRRQEFLPAVLESFRRLAAAHDLILVEGAGSPAEVNLRAGDIANMGFAAEIDAPVVLIGDIHRGGVIAQLVGTLAVLGADAGRIRGFLINNFHGDPALFADGRAFIEERTGRPVLGVIPHFPDAARLPAEDALALQTANAMSPASPANPSPTISGVGRGRGAVGGHAHITVPRLARIANFDDLDPLRAAPGVRLSLIPPGRALPGDADLVILPGSKSTRADMAFLRQQGWDIDIMAHARRGGRVLGICGGYQMLGRTIADPDGLEGEPGATAGLGLLDVETVLTGEKTVRETTARHVATDTAITAYEIHLGRTTGPDAARPFALIGETPDGAVSADGRIAGTYLHGAFTSDAFRRAFLRQLGAHDAGPSYEATINATLDALAGHLAHHIDLDALLDLAVPAGRA